MPAELLILRHAKSDWAQNVSDFERPLNSRGERDAPRMGRWLLAQDLQPDAVLCSPATRARQTLEAVCTQAHIPVQDIQWIDALYLAALENLLHQLHETPAKTRRLLLVGHNPGLEDLLLHLAQPPVPRKSNGKLLTTAALARLRLAHGWSDLAPGTAQVLQIQYPGDLTD